jgi:hypothetical protein
VAEPTDRCASAQREITALEQKMANRTSLETAELEGLGQLCQQILMTHGQGDFARCMAARSEALTRDTTPDQLEQAREKLRSAQADGCR